MAKDDYYVLVAKILVYLYRRLKGKADDPPEMYLQPNTKDFPIREEYFDYVLEHMAKQELIEGVDLMYSNGSIQALAAEITEDIRITPKGIDFLIENNTVRKALKEVPMAAGIMSLFI